MRDIRAASKVKTIKLSRTSEFDVRLITLPQIVISKKFALTAEHRTKDEKDLRDLSWITTNHPDALTEANLGTSLAVIMAKKFLALRLPGVKVVARLFGLKGF